ncbi:C39 family peptidase [Ruminococcaceae bacterium OttesenSCG-928-I18]|nr:C39 family peptidase [Ruminococcaceae bacterium OttesenSCG-928-I18]
MKQPKKRNLLLFAVALLLTACFSVVLLVATGAVLLPEEWFDGREPSFSQAATSAENAISQGEPHQKQVRLRVRNILQRPELPNGCEATALAVVLQYLGYPADKMELAYTYLPREDFYPTQWGVRAGPDPHQAYPGDPGVEDGGYYCYPAPVVSGANHYLQTAGGSHTAMDISGADEDALLSLLQAGLPLMVWKTTDNTPPKSRADVAWLLPDGQLYEPITNLHVVVLTGYDEESFYYCDPLEGSTRLDREVFMTNYEQAGGYVVAFAHTE